MDEPLYMVQLRFDPRRFGRLTARCDDEGYGAHQVLLGLFGKRAPKPFRLKTDRERVTILGYARAPLEELHAYAQAAAEPDMLAACDWTDSAGKRLPTDWRAGMRFQFDVQVCPIKRTRARSDGGKAREIDVWLDQARALPKTETAPLREDVYRQWLVDHFERHPGAQIDAARLVRFERTRLTRRHHGEKRRKPMERPLAELHGELTITDPDAFSTLLARGVGRHRAFGFGMLLLRPC